MRIDRLDLIAYGPFTDKSIDLSEGTAGLHIIYGDNEAGKSTTLRALIAWLFGIPTRTRDNHVHANPQLRIGGKLRRASGETLEFVRRKGRKGTLLDPLTEATLDEAVLAPYLPEGVDEVLFTKLYGFDYDRLISGGNELLNQSGDLGQALFSAAVGTADLRSLLSDLKTESEALYRPRASTKIVNQAIAGFKEARTQVKAASLPVAEWKMLQQELQDTRAEIGRTETAIGATSRQKSRLDRLSRVKGALAERRSVIARLDDLKGVLRLPQDFDQRRTKALAKHQNAVESKTRAQTRLSRLKTELERLNVQTELLDNEAFIISLHKELGAVEKAKRDKPQQDAKRRLLRNQAQPLLKGLRPDMALDQADQLRALTNNKKWISDLARKHGLLTHASENAKAALHDIEDEIKALGKKLSGRPQSDGHLDELKTAVAAARKSGKLEKRLSELQQQVSEESRACDQALARLGKFGGTIEALARTALPVSETLDRFEKRYEDMAQRTRDTLHRKNETAQALQQARQELTALLLTADIPTVADLDNARAERNRDWQLIKGKYFRGLDIAAEIDAFAEDIDLAARYEQKIDAADGISDRMRLSADLVAQRAHIDARVEDLETQLTTIADQQIENERDQAEYDQAWKSIWRPLDIAPGTPREMKRWLLEAAHLLSRHDAIQTVSGEAQKVKREIAALKASISAHIQKFDVPIDTTDMTLEAMLTLCENRIEQATEDLQHKRQIAQSLAEKEIRSKRIREEIAETETERVNWSAEWAKAIHGLGVAPDAHPQQVTEAFEKLLLFFENYDKSEELRKRIFGMDRVVQDFATRVAEFTDKINFDVEGLEASDIVTRLNDALNEAREARASQKELASLIKELQADIDDADVTIQWTQAQLFEMQSRAGVDGDEALAAAIEGSQRKHALHQKLEILEQELARNGDGLAIEALENEAEQVDIDGIDDERQKVSATLEELQHERDRLRDLKQALQNRMDAQDGGALAAKAGEDAEAHLANMVSGIEQYLRLQIAALLLEQQIESYRKKNQAPVLARAGKLFATLTRGSYIALRDELDQGGNPILLGLRPDNKEVFVEGMSDGTRDQLYLALRLAALEQHLKEGESVPFVIDDILIGFDDDRTKACLEVLGALSKKTQVLLFTHHRRVLELSQTVESKSAIYCHEIS